MIDLSFLTEAEQEAILKVLNRDAELKKAEDERVKNLQDVVHDENEFKYKSGQWFYDAKSKRHREKIHGVDLVRASIRKRKKPATIELFGVMEAPDEAEEDIMVKKQEGNQSSKKVGFTSAEKEKDNLRNGTFSPPKARLNPFNSEGLQDETDYKNEAPSLNPENVQMNGTEKPKSDKEPLYAVVNKPSAAASPSQAQDKKPEVGSPEVSNSKPGMDESNPILRALKRSEAKMLNFKAVEEVSPTSTNQLNSSSPTEDIPVNSFPQNPEKLKRLSQSVPAFINDDVSGSVMSIYSGDFGNVDIKGAIEFSIDYVEQLKEFLIYMYQCRELAVAEAKKQRSDPYVKAYLLPEKAKMGKRKTSVKKKTLNPVYNEILKYKISKESLLAQTLNLSVWHHDALGRNSFLGEVNVNLGTWDWSDKQRKWYQLEPRTPAAGIGLENRGEMKIALKYVPMSSSGPGTKPSLTGEVHISIKDCLQLPMLRGNKINSFVKCTVLPDTSRKSRQRTRTVDKTPNPYFNHTMVYDGFKEEDLREACVELTVWDHNRLSNHFLGGLRIGLGTGKSYGTPVDWMDSTHEEVTMWEKMMASPDTWVEGMLPLRMFKMAKLAK